MVVLFWLCFFRPACPHCPFLFWLLSFGSHSLTVLSVMVALFWLCYLATCLHRPVLLRLTSFGFHSLTVLSVMVILFWLHYLGQPVLAVLSFSDCNLLVFIAWRSVCLGCPVLAVHFRPTCPHLLSYSDCQFLVFIA